MAGNSPNPAARLSKQASQNTFKSTSAPIAKGKMIGGLLTSAALAPDVLYVQKAAESVATSPDGTIGATGILISWLIAVTTMLGLTFAIHLWFARLRSEMLNSLYFWMAMLALVVVTVQPLGLILEQAGQAGSGFGSNDTNAGSALAFWSSVLQILALPVCAIIASLGLGIFLDGLREYRVACTAGKDAMLQRKGASEILEGEREANEVANVLREAKAQMKSEWVDNTHAAVMSIAIGYELYVEGVLSR